MNPLLPPTPNPPPGWQTVPQHPLPEPTLWPAALALGSTFIVWGLASSLIITGVGLALFGVALGGWIREIRHERKQTQSASH